MASGAGPGEEVGGAWPLIGRPPGPPQGLPAQIGEAGAGQMALGAGQSPFMSGVMGEGIADPWPWGGNSGEGGPVGPSASTGSSPGGTLGQFNAGFLGLLGGNLPPGLTSPGPIAGWLEEQFGINPTFAQVGLGALGFIPGLNLGMIPGLVNTIGRGVANNQMAQFLNQTLHEPGGLTPASPAPPGLPELTAEEVSGIAPPGPEEAGEEGLDGDGDGDGGGTGTVICTELHRQSLMDDATWAADEAFGRRVPSEVRAGYLLWAPTVVGWMRASRVMTWLVARLALPWAREMAYGDSLFGRVVMACGWGICGWLGRATGSELQRARD